MLGLILASVWGSLLIFFQHKQDAVGKQFSTQVILFISAILFHLTGGVVSHIYEKTGYLLVAVASVLYVSFAVVSLKMMKNDVKSSLQRSLQSLTYSYYFFVVFTVVMPVFVDLLILQEPTERISKEIMHRLDIVAVWI